jgi:hypothetical protein
MWERMSESESGGMKGLAGADFMSTHPANAKRIKQLGEWMHEVSRSCRSLSRGSVDNAFYTTRPLTFALPRAAVTRLANSKHSGKRYRLVKAREFGDELRRPRLIQRTT